MQRIDLRLMGELNLKYDNIDFLFQSRVPVEVWIVLLASLVVLSAAVSFSSRLNKRKRIVVCSFLLLSYLLVVLCNTVIFRSTGTNSRVELIPFWSYMEVYKTGRAFFLVESLLNIALFIPIGVLLSRISKIKKLYIPILFGFTFSLLIEITQYICKRGWFETDDIIHNTLGCVIGFGIIICFAKRKHHTLN